MDIAEKILIGGLVLAADSSCEGWTYRRVESDLAIQSECAKSLAERCVAELDYVGSVVCGIGSSGVILATLLSQELQLPMVWLSRKHSITFHRDFLAQIRGPLLLVDALTVTGDAAKAASSDAKAAGRDVVGLAVGLDLRRVIEMYGDSTVRTVPEPVASVCKVHDYMPTLKNVLSIQDDQVLIDMVGEETFWKL